MTGTGSITAAAAFEGITREIAEFLEHCDYLALVALHRSGATEDEISAARNEAHQAMCAWREIILARFGAAGGSTIQ